MADYDRYRNQDRGRDRLGQRDVYLDDRTGIGDPPRGYRAEWGGGNDRDRDRGRYGDREENYNMRRAENPSFRDSDYGQPDGGRTGYRDFDDERRYGGTGAGGYYSETGSYGEGGGRWSRNRSYDETYGQGRYSQGASRYASGDQMNRGGADRDEERGFMSYPARSNPDFYADRHGSAGAGWAEQFDQARDRSLESYRGQHPEEGRSMRRGMGRDMGRGSSYGGGQDYGSAAQGGPTRYRGAHSYEADYTEGRDHDRERRGGGGRSMWDKVTSWFSGDEDRDRMDMRESHRGRGPKGYRRSDERIREDVSDRLTDDHWLDATSIEVRVENCDVVLSGTVKSRDDKRRAEQLAEQVSGVENVQNNLRVEKQNQGSNFGAGASASSGGMGGATGMGTSGASGSMSHQSNTGLGATTADVGNNLGSGLSTTGNMSGAAGSGASGGATSSTMSTTGSNGLGGGNDTSSGATGGSSKSKS